METPFAVGLGVVWLVTGLAAFIWSLKLMWNLFNNDYSMKAVMLHFFGFIFCGVLGPISLLLVALAARQYRKEDHAR